MQHLHTKHNKTFVIAIDGSALAARAARLACQLSNPGEGDRVRLASIYDDREYPRDTMEKHCDSVRKDLTAAGFPGARIDRPDLKPKVEGKGIAELLSDMASGGILVMGAGGLRLEKEWNAARAKKGSSMKSQGSLATGIASSSAAAAIGSVALQCMNICKAPVIICKRGGTPEIDKVDFYFTRKPQLKDPSRQGVSIVCCVTSPTEQASTKCFDMAKRVSVSADFVHVVSVMGISNAAEVAKQVSYWKGECAKASALNEGKFSYAIVPSRQGDSIPTKIMEYCDGKAEQHEDVIADLIILASSELAKAGEGKCLGSVTAMVAARTEAHVLIAKHFAP